MFPADNPEEEMQEGSADSPAEDAAEAKTEDAGSKYDKVGHWIKWIKQAKEHKARKRQIDIARRAYAEYELEERDESQETQPKRGYNIYAESCWTLDPEYFSKNPVIASKRKHGIEDKVAITMSMIADRLGQHLVDTSHFFEAMEATIGDFMHAAKAAPQIIYTAQTETIKTPLQPHPQVPNAYIDETGSPYQGQVLQDPATGAFYAEKTQAIESTQKIVVAPSPFDETLHTPEAKTQADIQEIAYRCCLDKDEAEEKFNTGDDGCCLGRNLPYKTVKDDSDVDDDDDDDESGGEKTQQLECWEIWCLRTKKVYWVCEGFKEDFLCPPEEDPYGLRGFFPSPAFALKNRRRKTLYPTPPWRYLEATANQLHLLYERIFMLIGKIDPKCLVYGAAADVVDTLNKIGGGMYVAVHNEEELLEKGGLNKNIEWVDLQSLVGAIAEAVELEAHFDERFSKAFGIPDILQGISDPNETAEAQGIKADAGHSRFKKDKAKITELARESAEMMLDLALKVFSPEKIKRICGHEYMERGRPAEPPQPPTPENPQGTPGRPAEPSHYELFDIALERLQNDEERLVSIDFETESTNFRDEQRDIQRATLIQSTVTNGLATIGGMQNQEFMPTILQMLLGVLDAIGGGSSKAQNLIKAAVSELEKRKNAPPAPPPPDTQMMLIKVKEGELALKQQIASADKAREDFLAQLEKQKLDATAALENVKQSLTQQIEGMSLALQNKQQQIDDAKRQGDEALKAKELQIREAEIEKKSALEAYKLDSERKINVLYAQLEAQKVENDRVRVQHEEVLSKMRVIEKFMEEQRLRHDLAMKGAQMMGAPTDVIG